MRRLPLARVNRTLDLGTGDLVGDTGVNQLDSLMNPPPLPQNQTPPPVPAAPPPRRRSGSAFKWIAGVISVFIVVAVIIVGVLAAKCPNEAQLRDAVYGEVGPDYKMVLIWYGAIARAFHLPHLVYHNHVVYSTLDWEQGGQETRVASGMAGHVELTSNVRDIKELLMSVPMLREKLQEKK